MPDENLTEIWLPVVGCEGLYEVSDMGRVRSVARRFVKSNGCPWSSPGRLMATSLGCYGYQSVTLTHGGKGHTSRVHRLVLLAFCGPPPDGHEACHRDGDRANSRLSNLRWGSRARNRRDQLAHGTHNRGTNHARSILTESAVRDIRRRAQTTTQLAEKYGTAVGTIRQAARRRSWWWLPPFPDEVWTPSTRARWDEYLAKYPEARS